MGSGEKKSINDAEIGDIVKSVDSKGNLINTEIVSIMHKNTNMTSKKLFSRELLFLFAEVLANFALFIQKITKIDFSRLLSSIKAFFC